MENINSTSQEKMINPLNHQILSSSPENLPPIKKKTKITLPIYLIIFYFILPFLGIFIPKVGGIIFGLLISQGFILHKISFLSCNKFLDDGLCGGIVMTINIIILIVIYPTILFLIGSKIDKKIRLTEKSLTKSPIRKKMIILISFSIIVLLLAFYIIKYTRPQMPSYIVTQKVLEKSSDVRIPFESSYNNFLFGGLWGFKNDKGQVVIPAKYRSVEEFDKEFKGMAVVSDINENNRGVSQGAIDKMGNITIPIKYRFDFYSELSEDLFQVLLSEEYHKDKLGYMNTRGELIIQPEFSVTGTEFSGTGKFLNGKAKVATTPTDYPIIDRSKANYSFFCINNKGEKLFSITEAQFLSPLACDTIQD